MHYKLIEFTIKCLTFTSTAITHINYSALNKPNTSVTHTKTGTAIAGK